jgi:hypothetical protein
MLGNPLRKEISTRYMKFENSTKDGRYSDGNSLKTVFEEPIYKIACYAKDFFSILPQILEFNNSLSVSDSMLLISKNNSHIPHYKNILRYFEYAGIITNVRQIKVPLCNLRGRREAAKTVFDFTPSYQKVLIMDKEFNLYGANDNGVPFQKGRFELGENGCWGVCLNQ